MPQQSPFLCWHWSYAICWTKPNAWRLACWTSYIGSEVATQRCAGSFSRRACDCTRTCGGRACSCSDLAPTTLPLPAADPSASQGCSLENDPARYSARVTITITANAPSVTAMESGLGGRVKRIARSWPCGWARFQQLACRNPCRKSMSRVSQVHVASPCRRCRKSHVVRPMSQVRSVKNINNIIPLPAPPFGWPPYECRDLARVQTFEQRCRKAGARAANSSPQNASSPRASGVRQTLPSRSNRQTTGLDVWIDLLVAPPLHIPPN